MSCSDSRVSTICAGHLTTRRWALWSTPTGCLPSASVRSQRPRAKTGRRACRWASGAFEPDRLALILGIGDAGAKGPRGLLFQAHYKINHRFMVIEDIATVCATPGDRVRFGHLPRDQATVMGLVGNIAQVALSTGELAALLLMLDQAGGAGAE